MGCLHNIYRRGSYLWFVICDVHIALEMFTSEQSSEFKVHLSIHYLLIPYFEDLKFLDVSFPNRCQFLVIGLNQDNPYTLSIHL